MSKYDDSDWDDHDSEEEDAAEGIETKDINSAVVTDTDWTTETILSQLRRGNIQLNPRFQRRDAWDKNRKSRFIESLILRFPIPQIVLAEDRNHRGKFLVLDGKQRLLALRQFAAGSSFSVSDESDSFSGYALSGIEIRKDLHGATLKKMEEDDQYVEDMDALLNETIRTVVVRQWPNEAFLNLVFLRLNTGSVKLSPQELRQALHPGPFTDYLDEVASGSADLLRALRKKKPDFRMRDVEILLRYFAFYYNLGSYTGNLKNFLDEAVGYLNSRWESNEDEIRSVGKSCEEAITATFEIFGNNAFFRWSRNDYEGRFNRAVFDIMTYYFCNERIRTRALEVGDEVEAAFRRLCEENSNFVESIQTTTKTPLATHRRLSLWGEALKKVLDVDVPIPAFSDNKIIP